MASHEINVYVRFAETDAAGHVNNVSYFLYFEEARTKLFQEICPERGDSLNFILASISCDYVSQAYPGQRLKLLTDVEKVGGKSFTVSHTMINLETAMTVARSQAVTVCFNYEEQKTINIPHEVRSRLENYLVAQ
ncbi:acyl-CoA thioester hydrolase [Lentibacillus halodurans]|uniref:Acyl-CoA thioester hydrolase n=1 Tax=Lentibacillus halodurans TaxID=237679 RepID=A0A1I0ZD70_9BACI|nr:thioesterase family protein [Lentibacillus halodurans]SFB22368.1 acyl-CoA thioester hydrolase [Lentibacillus halodurans]